MVAVANVAQVRLWGNLVGAVLWEPEKRQSTFEFDQTFVERGLDIAPIRMPLADLRRGQRIFTFRNLAEETYRGLPGLLADSLPDKYGNRLIEAWLARHGRSASDFSPIEHLCYVGRRGMGALEFEPMIDGRFNASVSLQIEELVRFAREIFEDRERFGGELGNEEALMDIVRVGTSAGGARPKAVIALNEETNEVRSGQVPAPAGFGYWLLKFDGVKDKGLGDPEGYGRIEYAYYNMALACGITMSKCRLMEEGGRAHFMTQRFDRSLQGEKIHMQSLTGLAHFDFNMAGAHSYEEAFQIMRKLRLPYPEAEQLFRRMVFNVIARNQDDHPKNFSFLMGKEGKWSLSPAYDVTYAHNPGGIWTNMHQMSIGGKRDNFEREDLLAVGRSVNVKNAAEIIDSIVDVVAAWFLYAREAGVKEKQILDISKEHRIRLGRKVSPREPPARGSA